MNEARVAVATEREDRGHCGLLHSWECRRLFKDLVVERKVLCPGVVGRPRRVDGADEDVRRVESEIRALQAHECLQQERASGQEHERERHFGDDQRSPHHAAGRRGRATPAVLERMRHLAARRLQGRSEAESTPVTSGEQCREGEHHRIQTDFADPRCALRRNGNQRVNRPHAEQHARDPADDRRAGCSPSAADE